MRQKTSINSLEISAFNIQWNLGACRKHPLLHTLRAGIPQVSAVVHISFTFTEMGKAGGGEKRVKSVFSGRRSSYAQRD